MRMSTTTTPSLQLRDVHLTHRYATSHPRITTLETRFVDFAPEPGSRDGGYRSISNWYDGGTTGLFVRPFAATSAERAAAQAVRDAVLASGLLVAELPHLSPRHPDVGRTRLHLDSRRRVLEFDTANPPAVVRPILDAIRAWELIAERSIADAG